MRWQYGRIPENPAFAPAADGWTPLREPPVWAFQLAGSAAGVAAAAAVFYLWGRLTTALAVPDRPLSASEVLGGLGLVALAAVGVVAAHEAAHLVAHPGGGTRRASVVGVWPAALIAYAHYDGPMSRNRFVAMILAPFAALSLGTLAAGAAAGVGSPWVAGCSVLNGALAGGDLVTAGLVLAQVPPRAEVRNQGWWTWWRPTGAGPTAAPDRRDG